MNSSLSRDVRVLAIPILLIGIWGGLVPFVGPTFGFYMGGKVPAWTWSESHATLHVAPAVAAALGASMMLLARRPLAQAMGGTLAMCAGIWFVLGPSLHSLWAGSTPTMSHASGMMSGMMSHAAGMTPLEAVGYHYGVGSVIAVLAAFAVGLLAAALAAPAGATATERPRRAEARLGHPAHVS